MKIRVFSPTGLLNNQCNQTSAAAKSRSDSAETQGWGLHEIPGETMASEIRD